MKLAAISPIENSLPGTKYWCTSSLIPYKPENIIARTPADLILRPGKDFLREKKNRKLSTPYSIK
tara:strand:+ start:400 stop:594 length:195 start_codon:yes stop_codon:yes gene_type:complete